MNKCLHAWTEPGSAYPPFINVSTTDANPDMLTIIVRERSRPHPMYPDFIKEGDMVEIAIPMAEAEKLAEAILVHKRQIAGEEFLAGLAALRKGGTY